MGYPNAPGTEANWGFNNGLFEDLTFTVGLGLKLDKYSNNSNIKGMAERVDPRSSWPFFLNIAAITQSSID
ncbi:hypothetical protein RSAG8_02445, partial [Rhizoctonia solani AG-8 WAC10335]